MARKGTKSGGRSGPASINAIKTFKDTLQEGGVDECKSTARKVNDPLKLSV